MPLPILAALVFATAATAETEAPAPLSKERRAAIVREIETLETAWFSVYVSHDLTVLEQLMADDLVATMADGAMRGKKEQIASYPADFAALAKVVASEQRVRVYSPTLAVATGLYTATPKDSAAAPGRYRYTDTWARRGDRWQCVATHENKLE
jgi:uncharacterized protein (TIGR02246 family)